MTNVFELDQSYLELIDKKFIHKKKIADNRRDILFSIFDEDLTEEEEVALKYIFAYMSLNDLADYEGNFFLTHVRKMLDIRDTLPWGKTVPGQLFLHFVMPIRINNENLELFCGIFFDALFDRVKDLTMEEAILEINHWCHENASYVGCDIRTKSPLTLMKNGLGRCGEESSLATAALRSCCIPARQCYTPRWAHCDSNHAWVEAWADGTWYFLGACEPDPKLNMGWFSGPAKRAMLVHTRVAGNYLNYDEVTLADKWYTELNLLQNYTDIKKVTVKVVDENREIVEGAEVHFQLYNMAEFYPIARLKTNEKGEVSLTTGYGDLFIHAFNGQSWGEGKISGKDEYYIELTISQHELINKVVEMDMVPPPEISCSSVNVTAEEEQKNNERLKYEDDLRAVRDKTFVQQKDAVTLAKELHLDETEVWDILRKARANSHGIAVYLKKYVPTYGKMALKLLQSLNDKDFIDTTLETLKDHLVYSVELQGEYDEDTFVNYIMCPRIYFEMLGAYKHYFQGNFSDENKLNFRNNPETLIQWTIENIKILNNYTCYEGFATPKGSFELKLADSFSRDIMFVALARSLGIPSRLEPSDYRPQYLKNGSWEDVFFDRNNSNECKLTTGRVRLITPANSEIKSEYFHNFSLARFQNNVFNTLDYYFTDFSFFENYFDLPVGFYRLMTGTRLTDGTVLTRLNLFEVKEGSSIDIDLVYREDSVGIENLGRVSLLDNLQLINPEKDQVMNYGDIKVIAWIEPDREPSKHLIRELKELAEDFNQYDANIFMCIGEDKLTSAFDMNAYKGLPQCVHFMMDKDYTGLDSLMKAVNKDINDNHPVVFVIDKDNIIRYASSGYKLGIGNEIVKVINELY